MKVKTSITISDEILHEIDSNLTNFKNRSSFIEAAIRFFLIKKVRESRNDNDLNILNENSDKFNDEAEDVLEFQDIF